MIIQTIRNYLSNNKVSHPWSCNLRQYPYNSLICHISVIIQWLIFASLNWGVLFSTFYHFLFIFTSLEPEMKLKHSIDFTHIMRFFIYSPMKTSHTRKFLWQVDSLLCYVNYKGKKHATKITEYLCTLLPHIIPHTHAHYNKQIFYYKIFGSNLTHIIT